MADGSDSESEDGEEGGISRPDGEGDEEESLDDGMACRLSDLASESEPDDLAVARHRCGSPEPLAVLPDAEEQEQSDEFEEFEEPFETVFCTRETEEDGPPPVVAPVVVRGPVSSASPFAGLPLAALHSRSEPVCAPSDCGEGSVEQEELAAAEELVVRAAPSASHYSVPWKPPASGLRYSQS